MLYLLYVYSGVWKSKWGHSCSKICLVSVNPKKQADKKLKVYAIMDDQSNRSLSLLFFDAFNISMDNLVPYTLKTCTGVSETAGRRASNFIIESADGQSSLHLPTLTECNTLPDNCSEIPTPDVIPKQHPRERPSTSLSTLSEHLSSEGTAPPASLFVMEHTKTIRSVFQHSTNDERPAPSLEDQGFLHIMEKEMYQDETNSWVAPLPFRLPRRCLLNKEASQNREAFHGLHAGAI